MKGNKFLTVSYDFSIFMMRAENIFIGKLAVTAMIFKLLYSTD